MPLVGFERVIPARERPETHAFDRAATRNASIAVRPYKRHKCFDPNLGHPQANIHIHMSPLCLQNSNTNKQLC